MNVVICHTDFRIYWPARISGLRSFLNTKGVHLHIIELVGAGSPYAFSKEKKEETQNWHILFPQNKIEDLNANQIKEKLFNKLDSLMPDVVIAGAIAFPSGALSIAWCKKRKKKIVIFDDAKFTDFKRNIFVNYIKQQIYNCVDAMLYPSEKWIPTGIFWKFTEKQLFYGVDVVDNQFWFRNEDLDLSHTSSYIVSVGRLIPKKNFLFLLDAYSSIKASRCTIPELWIVGEGEERGRLEQYIRENKVNGVRLLPFHSQYELKKIYKQAVAFILASKCDETWGLVINEAMACGLPIIASNRCGATVTLVKEGVNGFVFDPLNKESLTKALMSYFSLSADQKVQMGNESINIIANWGIERFVQSCYDAICYTQKQQYEETNLISSLLLKFWKGRYRPL